uniref:Protocadherin 2 alpha a 15 n=1 Tax=Sander lucioperca TaxID=283035 RepID=A0A8C9XFX4_SANLU
PQTILLNIYKRLIMMGHCVTASSTDLETNGTLLDVNDHSPSFPENNKRLEISESTLPGTRFQLHAALDPDGGVNSVQQYRLSPNNNFRLEVKDSGKDGKVPVLQIQSPLDRETSSSHKLLLTALDGGKPPKSGTMEIYIDILDVNDNAPVFTKDVYSAEINEDSPIGTIVIRVNATDMDDRLNGDVSYSFGNVNSKVRELFDVDPNTGEITVKGQLNYEVDDSYEINIQASDSGAVPFRTEKSVTVNIKDINDNAPVIEVTSLSNTISEDSRLGTTVALLSITDSDSGVNGKVISFAKGDVPFTLTPSIQDNMYAVVTNSQLDRENKSIYDVTVIAKDAGEPALTSVKTLRVVVSDVNDNSPEFSISRYNFYVTENNPPGMSVFYLTASDRDEGDNALISYNILRDAVYSNKVTSFISINSENGDISALKSFDFETVKTFQFQVVATDSGTPSLSSNVTVNVFILDQNDNAPVILYPVSSNGSAEGVEEIPRNVNAGHLVTKVRAYDADIGYNGWLLFSLQEVTDHKELCHGSGACLMELKILVENPLEMHHVVVEITDVNDHSPSFSEKEQQFQIFEHTSPGTRFDLHAARDPDAGSNSIRTYTLTSNDHFEIDISQNDEDKIPFLVLKKSLDREQKNKHVLFVTAVDGGKPHRSGTLNVSIIVLDINDNRPMFSQDTYQIEIYENVPVGTTVTRVNATDPDEGTNGEIEYSLSKTLPRKIYEIFELDSLSGQLKLKGTLDFEESEIYKLDIQASDKGDASINEQDITAGYCFHCRKLLTTVSLVWTAIQDRSEHFAHSQRQTRLSINWSYW